MINFGIFLAKFWPEKITSRDGCVLLMQVRAGHFGKLSGNFWEKASISGTTKDKPASAPETLTLQRSNPGFFFFGKKKTRETPKNLRVFLFAEALYSLEKKGKTHKKKQGKSENKKKRKSKKARVGGSGKTSLFQTYERRRKLFTLIPANLVFQACISFYRCFETFGPPRREILVYTGMLPCLAASPFSGP